MQVDDTLTLKRFPVVVHTDCKNINRIYPIKQRQVAAIYDKAKDFDIIRKIIIFGSSVTARCKIDSDLDVCIDADTSDGMKVYDMQKAFGEVCDWNCDMIMYAHMGQALRETIQREGVVIYE